MGIAEVGEELARDGSTSARLLGGDTAVSRALGFLDRREAGRGAPLVDEAERLRLERAAAGDGAPTAWYPVAAVDVGGDPEDGEPTGYAGVRTEPEDDLAEADIVADPGPALTTLVAAAGELAGRAEVELRVWLRAADDDRLAAAAALGLEEERRLAVLGRALDRPGEPPDPPGGVVLRAFEEDDAPGIVELLRAAYADTPDGGWTPESFRERRARAWFRPEDLIVAEGRHAAVEGIHWTKRRGDGVGEVHNLAVAPDAQGLGLGRALLRAGLRHLWRVGCSEVVLWMDSANDAALDLYRSEGFETRWVDVALVR